MSHIEHICNTTLKSLDYNVVRFNNNNNNKNNTGWAKKNWTIFKSV